MPSSSEVVRQQAQQSAVAPRGDGPPTVFELINRQKSSIEMALPAHLSSDRFTRIALTVVRQNRQLAECDAASLIGALMVSAQLGLEPGGPLGQAYLVPFKREVTFILGDKGIIELARRSGQLSSIVAHEVCENDEFSYHYGIQDHLEHRPVIKGPRGEAYAYYAIAKFKDGGNAFVVLSRDDIEKHRKRSSSRDRGPWVTDYDAMARKTCIRVLAPYLPLSPELERAMAADERSFRRIEPDMADAPELPAATEDEPDEAEVVSPAAIEAPAEPEADAPPAVPDGDEDQWDAKAWKAFLRANGVTEADFMRQVRSEAESFGEDPPIGLDVLKGRTRLCQLGRGWVEEMVEALA
jgi:recombination protein RecT